MTFNEAVERVIQREGGYVWDEHDEGGETKYGISKRSYPNVDIKTLTVDAAKVIYLNDFWKPLHCDELPAWIRLHLFDAAVNSGVKTAVKWLQQALGVEIDGIPGPDTRFAIIKADPARTIARFTGIRLRFMTDRKTWGSFGQGWARRIAANLMEV